MNICTPHGTRFKRAQWRCPACGHQPLKIDGFPALAPELTAGGIPTGSVYRTGRAGCRKLLVSRTQPTPCLGHADEAVLAEMLRTPAPGGATVLTVPQHPWLWSRQDEYACHVRRYGVGEMGVKVRRAGFKVEFAGSFVSLLLPAMLASRLLQRNASTNSDPMSELRLPTLINWVFEGVMKAERQLIRLGLRFPVGGSLMLVAKKSEVAG